SFHRPRGNLESLENKRGREQRKQHSNKQGFEVFRQRGFVAVMLLRRGAFQRLHRVLSSDVLGHLAHSVVAVCSSRSKARRAARCSVSFLFEPSPLAKRSPLTQTSI